MCNCFVNRDTIHVTFETEEICHVHCRSKVWGYKSFKKKKLKYLLLTFIWSKYSKNTNNVKYHYNLK